MVHVVLVGSESAASRALLLLYVTDAAEARLYLVLEVRAATAGPLLGQDLVTHSLLTRRHLIVVVLTTTNELLGAAGSRCHAFLGSR